MLHLTLYPLSQARHALANKQGKEWEILQTGDGESYYHSRLTGKTQWEKPENVSSSAELDSSSANRPNGLPEDVSWNPASPWILLYTGHRGGGERYYYKPSTEDSDSDTEWEPPVAGVSGFGPDL